VVIVIDYENAFSHNVFGKRKSNAGRIVTKVHWRPSAANGQLSPYVFGSIHALDMTARENL
jgi:hypothetical protein